MSKLLFKELHYDLIKYLAEKNSFKQIAEALGCSQTIVADFARKYGIKTFFKLRSENVRKSKQYILEKIASGISTDELAKEFNVHPSVIIRTLKSSGLKTKRDFNKEKVEIQKQKIKELIEECSKEMPLYSFSDKFEFSPYLVKQVAKELNIEFKSNYYMADMHEEIVSTLKDKTISQASKILDIDSEILRTYAKNNNIPYLKHKAKDRLPGYIVYAYYDKDDVVRYYGEGSREERAYQFKSHADSKGYSYYFSEDNLPTVKILHYGLSKEEAKRIEHDLVQENLSTVATIYNHPHTNRSKKSLDFEIADKYVYYDETSPTYLRWKDGHEYNGRRKKDSPAGYIKDANTYMSIRLGDKTYSVHVVVWLLHNKSFAQNMVIDHIDGNKLNNNISNLREVTVSFNCKNRLGRTNSGYKNVSWCEKNNGYNLRWNDGPERKNGYFSVAKYGSKENALEAALEKRKELIDQQLIIVREGD